MVSKFAVECNFWYRYASGLIKSDTDHRIFRDVVGRCRLNQVDP
jgi:hypothetical protein